MGRGVRTKSSAASCAYMTKAVSGTVRKTLCVAELRSEPMKSVQAVVKGDGGRRGKAAGDEWNSFVRCFYASARFRCCCVRQHSEGTALSCDAVMPPLRTSLFSHRVLFT